MGFVLQSSSSRSLRFRKPVGNLDNVNSGSHVQQQMTQLTADKQAGIPSDSTSATPTISISGSPSLRDIEKQRRRGLNQLRRVPRKEQPRLDLPRYGTAPPNDTLSEGDTANDVARWPEDVVRTGCGEVRMWMR